MDLALVYLLLIACGVLMYVLLDGFSLGVGIVAPWLERDEDKAIAVKSLSHLWDSNQTWLVFGGVTLFVAFPKAYSLVLSQLYLPIILMLIALIFRGVAFEFYFKSDTSRWWWNFSFSFGSILATLSQGLILGTLVQGGAEVGRLDWLTPFSLLTALSLLLGYGLLGSCWLVRKTEGSMARRSRTIARALLIGVVTCLGIVSVWMLLTQAQVAERWLTVPGIFILAPVPLLCGWVTRSLWQRLGDETGNDLHPLGLGMVLFLLSFIGLVAGMFPYIVPGQLTIWQALAPESTLIFALVGIVVLLPVVIGYNIYNYRVFAGKTRMEDGY
ncbi:cytochrome d ubiquinol oxidase subunit II [Hahella ganghwensis]|uniref:cytochrome d ubiquinol oxidase subunit II n=1 Tax=Hahella ganghwensis TaxID=286420 RepID=UPI00037A9FAD|nr:cytochrome d ubiquinol oxidase subunit II [Hahella ganghwensis]